MATGGYDRSVDSRVTCSICLEPYRGRQPKLLPCSHTFCLPCLTQIADKEKRRLTQASSEAETEITITCPTCRTLIPLPPTGVRGLNANVYVDDDSGGQSDPRPLLCDLCEEGHQAKLTCATCLLYFDTRCRRIHDKLCKSGPVSEITMRSSQMPEVRVESEEEEDEENDTAESSSEVAMLKSLLKKLKEKEKEKKTQKLKKTSSKQTLMTSPSGASLAENTEQNVNGENLASIVSQLMNKVTTLESHVSNLQHQNTLLCRDLTSLHDKHDREMTSLKAAGKKDRDALASLQKEVASLRDKNTIMCQDNQELRNDLTKLQNDVTKGRDDVKTLQAHLANLQSSWSSMQAELTKYQSVTQAQLTTVQTTQSTMKAELTKRQSTMQSELTKYHDVTQAQLTTFQSTQSTMKAELTKYQSTHSSMKAELTAVKIDLQTEQNRQNSDIANMKTRKDKLQKDLGKLESDFRGLQSQQDKLKGALSKQVSFQARREESNNFTLNDEETVICDEVVSSVGGGYDPTTGVFTVPVSGVYGFMFSSNPNDDDNDDECSSTIPESDDNDDSCAVDIMLDDNDIGYMYASRQGSCTVHAFVHAMSGQKVFIRSFDTSKFYGGCLVTFSGALIQPDL